MQSRSGLCIYHVKEDVEYAKWTDVEYAMSVQKCYIYATKAKELHLQINNRWQCFSLRMVNNAYETGHETFMWKPYILAMFSQYILYIVYGFSVQCFNMFESKLTVNIFQSLYLH